MNLFLTLLSTTILNIFLLPLIVVKGEEVRGTSTFERKYTTRPYGFKPNNGVGISLGERMTAVSDALLENEGKWFYVPFSKFEKFAGKGFILSAHSKFYIQIVDLYCTGDQFKVIGEQMSIGGRISNIWEGQTTSVPSDRCLVTSADPNETLNLDFWSKGTFLLDKGDWRISFSPILTSPQPNGEGEFGVRFWYQ